MPTTPDRFPGTREEEEIKLIEDTVAPTEEGAIRYVNGSFSFIDSTGSYDPRSGGEPGVSQTTHQVLRQLIHFINDGPAEGFATGAYREILPVGAVFPTSKIWWENSSKLKKIVEKLTSWTGVNPTTIQWQIYDIDGTTILGAVTDTISYSGVFETSRTRAISGGIVPGGGLPAATQQGQVFFSVDGLTFTIEQPLTSYPDGWLVNNDGYLLVVG